MVGLQRPYVWRRHVDEARGGVAEQRVLPTDAARDGAVHVEIEPAIVVDVGRRAGVVARVDGESRRHRTILELAAPAVAEEAERAVVGGQQVEPPVAIHVGGAHPHGAVARIARTAAAPRHTRRLGDVHEDRAVVAEQAIGVAVHVGHRHVEVAVFVGVEPHRADRLAGIGQPECRRPIGEHATVVDEQRVGAIAERDEQVEVAVAIGVDECGLAYRPCRHAETRRRGGVGEDAARVAIQAQHRSGRSGREPEQQVGVAVGIDIPEGRGPGSARIGHASGRRDIREHAAVVAIEPVGRAIEADEEVEVAVAVDVGQSIHEVRARREQVGLHRLEGRPRLHPYGRGSQDHTHGQRAGSKHGAW